MQNWQRSVGAGALCFLSIGLVVWIETPLPTAAARCAWREWRLPALAIALDRGDVALLMEIGSQYFGSVPVGGGIVDYDPVLAKRAFAKAVRIDPTILWGHYSLARIAFARGDFKTALAEINAELAANPENLRALYIRGLIYGYRNLPGDLALAAADFTRFSDWAPTEWAGWNDLAWILAKEGKYREVEQAINEAFKQVPNGRDNPWLWNELGVARLNQGNRAGALDALARAETYAARLSVEDWRRAYSGNSPTTDAEGLDVFRTGIEANLAKAVNGT